jgi:hypothetical protein
MKKSGTPESSGVEEQPFECLELSFGFSAFTGFISNEL